MKLCNIKISVKFKNPFYKKQKINKKIKRKVKNLTFIQYMHSPFLVNITGIRSKRDIEEAILSLETEYTNICTNVTVDSCMFSHKDFKNIKLTDIVKNLNEVTNIYYADYNPEVFTGCYLKPYKKHRGYPTINIFHTSSFQLIGGNCFKKIEESANIARHLIKLSQLQHPLHMK